MMRTSNPALNDRTFAEVALEREERAATTDVMTLEGTATRTAALLAILVVCAGLTWSKIEFPSDLGTATGTVSFAPAMPWMIGGLISSLVLFLVLMFKKTWAPFLAPGYAACEGLFLGGLSAIFEFSYPGIVGQAVALTFGTLAALLLAYRLRIIQATENFRLGVFAATGGIALVYLASIVLGFFGISIPLIHESGVVGIAFSVFVVVVAALNLVLDFDFIESGVEHRAPKYMEWYAGFGLLVTLVWLYVEFLRLLAKLRDN